MKRDDDPFPLMRVIVWLVIGTLGLVVAFAAVGYLHEHWTQIVTLLKRMLT